MFRKYLLVILLSSTALATGAETPAPEAADATSSVVTAVMLGISTIVVPLGLAWIKAKYAKPKCDHSDPDIAEL